MTNFFDTIQGLGGLQQPDIGTFMKQFNGGAPAAAPAPAPAASPSPDWMSFLRNPFGGAPAAAPAAPAPTGTSARSQNPYLQELGGNMTDQMTQNFQRQVMPGLRSGTMVAGGYGGSRQGVLEANAQNDMQKQLASGLSSLYGSGFQSSLNYDLGKYQSDNSLAAAQASAAAASAAAQRNYELGMAQLQRQQQNDAWNQQLQGAQFGLGMYDRLGNNNSTAWGLGTQVQNTPMNYWQNFANQSNAFGQGYGTQTNSAPTYGSPMTGALGGMQMGQSLGNLWGSPNAYGGSNSAGWGTGSGYGNQDYGAFF